MTRDKIQQLAHEAGAYETEDALGEAIVLFNMADLERFTALVLEEAAKVCESKNPNPDQWSDQSEFTEKRAVLGCAQAIRATKPEVKT
jgi:hypothetical protein